MTGQAQGISGMSLVCRENEEDEHGATAHSGSLSSEAPVVAQPTLGSLELSIVLTSKHISGLLPSTSSLYFRDFSSCWFFKFPELIANI